VAFDDVYECHSCGAVFGAGLVRVPRAWGDGGEPMAEAARTEAGVSRGARGGSRLARRAVRSDRARAPRRPLVLGGCCCAHVGAIRWARGTALAGSPSSGSTPTATSTPPRALPSGNLWGMPLRMAIDEGSVRTDDVALVGARDLDPPGTRLPRRARHRRRRLTRARRRGRRLRRARPRRSRARAGARVHAGAGRPGAGRRWSGCCWRWRAGDRSRASG
jgi:hypothetical protein